MFTGLVQSIGTVTEARPSPAGLSLTIDPTPWTHTPAHGDSINVSGVCLTIANHPDTASRAWRFDAIPETLSKTTLGSLRPGSRINLEHALRATDYLGGHFVQGHIDGIATVARVQPDPADWRIAFDIPEPLRIYLAPKGSIALDGVSLTIAALTPTGLEVALIPTTLEKTTLAALKLGDKVNVEMDMLAKMIVGLLRQREAMQGS
jgi:riboflavin synthase